MSDLLRRLQGAVGDTYRLEQELPGGGMSRLFLATEASLRRRVVLKVLPPEFASEVSAARFRQEIEVAARLQHPHILPILAAGASDDLLYYVMPYVAGESLRHRLTREGKLPVAQALRVLHEIADALAFAHAEGVLHRDIKPENILLEGGHAVLTDFGVARALAESQSGGRLTASGFAVGTPGYMAPEQVAGERQVDGRADVYALAVVGYEMLAGAPPFSGASAQAVMAAHLTETPRPLTDLRSETPPAVVNAISRALAKDPGARLQSAAEFRDALADVHQRRGRRVRPVHVSAALAVVVLGGILAVLFRPRPRLDPNLVAVAPFDVLAPSLALWREGLVDVLSRNLDGAGPLRTVSPTIVVRRFAGRPDPTSAGELGRSTGAQLAVYGQLIGAGGDSVRAIATLFDVGAARTLAEIERRDLVDNMDRLADSLTLALLRELGRVRPVGTVRHSALGTRSFPAVKAFLQGEQYYRRAVWDSALAWYERAAEEDSTFALALQRIGHALGWQRVGTDSLSIAYHLRAGGFNRGLAPRDSLLIVADSLMGVMFGYVADAAYYQHSQRAVAALEEASRRYPDDPEVWYALGDFGFHFARPVDTPERVLSAFDRAIALDSSFAPAYIHQLRLAVDGGDPAAARRYAQLYLAQGPTDVERAGVRLALQLLDPGTAASAETQRMLDAAPPTTLSSVRTTIAHLPDSEETLIRVARVAASRPRDPVFGAALSRLRLAQALALRGHVREAYSLAGTEMRAVFGELAVLGAIPADTVGAAFARWGAGAPPEAIWWWSGRGDVAALERHSRQADSVARSAKPLPGRGFWRYRAEWAHASALAVRGDTAGALRRFEALPDSLCPLCYGSRLQRARLLAARGREREAADLLEWRIPINYGANEVLFRLEAGRLREGLGDRERAIAAYAWVAAIWKNADPELRAYVDEARAGLARLTGEPRR